MNLRILIGIIITATSFQLVAHNAKISTFNMRQFDGVWVLEMSFAQASLDAAILETLTEQEIDRMSMEEYKVWIVDYIRKNISVKSDFLNSFKIGDGGIRLGSHQTDLKFLLPDLPSNPGEISFSMPICSNSRNHTNILRIFYADEMHKFFLSSDNDFSVHVAIQDGAVKITEHSTQYAVSAWWLLILAPVFLVGRGLQKELKSI